MGEYRRLGWALLISLIVHGVLYLQLPMPDTGRTLTRFEIELTPSAPGAESDPVAEEKPREQPPESAVPELPAESDEHPVAGADTEQAAADPDPASEETDERESAPLDLSRPADWDEIVREVTVQDSRLAFIPDLGRALNAREADARRSRLIQQRSAAIYGVADEAYTRTGPLGEELKRDGGCVRLVEDRDVEEGQRWWASTCTETRENPFTLPVVEYDALGRVVAE